MQPYSNVYFYLLTDHDLQSKLGGAYYELLYRRYNPYVLLAHFINLSATLICYFVKFRLIPDDYVFVSPVAKLRWTNYALILGANFTSSSDTTCSQVSADSLAFALQQKTSPYYQDFLPHELYDLTGKQAIQYNRPGAEIHIIWAMFSFFVLSLLFQGIHYYYILSYPGMPRVLHYVEYAFSASLMIMVMAINVGIVELFAVTGMGAIFFGMNMLGACAEAMSHYAGYVPKDTRSTFTRILWLFHTAAWVLFLFAMIPIWVQLNYAVKCSDGGSPQYVIAAIVLESICFFLFGLLQVASVRCKLRSSFSSQQRCREGEAVDTEILFKYDCLHATLSLVAKTFLAWLLMGPAASVRI